MRVTAEVIDPNTQTTVYSVSADGNGAQSVLPSTVSEFTSARDTGLSNYITYPLIDAVERKFAQASAMYAKQLNSGEPNADVDVFIPQIAIAADQGNFQSVKELLKIAQQQADKSSATASARFRNIGLSLSKIYDVASDSSLRDTASMLDTSLKQAAPSERPDLQTAALFTAYLAAYTGESGIARTLSHEVNEAGAIDPGSRQSKLQSVALAQIALARGGAASAIRMLEPQLDGNELYLCHLVLLDAYTAKRELKSALSEAQWLAKHRGRAYSEWSVPDAIPFAVAQSDVALLRASESASALGDRKGAQAALGAFLAAWPSALQNAKIAARIRKLQTEY